MNILLAEDDENIVLVIKMSLEKLGGHTVTRVADGEQAVAKALESNYDLILLDSMMPKKDGMKACAELKQIHKIETPIIFLSAKSQETDIRDSLALGAIGYIQKPFDPKNINQKINEIMGGVAQEAA